MTTKENNAFTWQTIFGSYGKSVLKLGSHNLNDPNINEIQSALIDWHKGCKSKSCLEEVHRGHEILENCGSYVP